MLTIRQEQYAALQAAAIERFANESVAFLVEHAPNWCALRSHAEIKGHALAVIAFARAHDVRVSTNIHVLMLYCALHDVPADEIQRPWERLTEVGLDEDYRVEQFRLALTDDRHLVRISLDTDIVMLRRQQRWPL
jgi:hypothetical protein